MNERKSLYEASFGKIQMIVFSLALAMVIISIYMTSHYFDIHFPTGLTGGSLCDINSFFNCDVATTSSMAQLFNVPIAVFGAFIGVFTLLGFVFKNEKLEATNHFMIVANTVGCLGLFFYSLLALGSLCPFCTLYYICSFILTYLFYKNSSLVTPDFKVVGVYATIILIAGGIIASNISDKNEYFAKLAPSLIKQFDSLPNLGAPEKDLPYRLASATKAFKDAPIRVTEFSDFQCPACKALSNITAQLKKKYKGKINIQYSFYPLDPACHPDMKQPLHPLACKAAYLSSCLSEKFSEVHDEIFNNQENLSNEWLEDYARRENVVECMNSPKTKENVTSLISKASVFNVKSTPTILVNGVKIEGVRSLQEMIIIFDHILSKNGK